MSFGLPIPTASHTAGEICTCDLATRQKIGYLWLNQGRWDERQIIPAEWLQEAIQVHSRADWGDEYGYGMWVYPTRDVFEGNGRGGQRLSVVPSKNLVVVMTVLEESRRVVRAKFLGF